MTTYAVTFFCTAIIALLMTPLLIRLARRNGLVDAPGLRTVHEDTIPRIGGIAIAVPTILISVAVYFLGNNIGAEIRAVGPGFIGLLFSSLLVFAAGLYDDIRGIRVRYKFLAQIVAAVIVIGAGVHISELTVTKDLVFNLGWIGIPLTLFWIVGVTNAVNLIDGLDGLAGGVSAITCGVLAIFAIGVSDTTMAVIMLALLGSLCGFLFFNFNPAKIFMGDCGSLFLGFVLATSSVICSQTKMATLALALPLLALGVPIFDTLFSMVRRALARRSMFAADRGHIHHRLLDMGLNQRQVVLVIYALTLVVAGLGGLTVALEGEARVVPFFVGVSVLIIAFRLVGVVRLRESIKSFQRNTVILRERQEERRALEEAELCFRNVENLEDWWGSASMAADILGFSDLQMQASQGQEDSVLTWRSEDRPERRIRLQIPVQVDDDGLSIAIYASMPVNGSVEAAARRSASLGRLIDENPPVEVLQAKLSESRRRRRLDGRPRGPVRPLQGSQAEGLSWT